MGIYRNMTGEKFGLWVVLREGETYRFGGRRWVCECACGTQRVIRTSALRRGHTTSCGCKIKAQGYPHRRGASFGYKGTQLYNTYYNIRKRCENTRNEFFYCYGGRGIKCLWRTFQDFLRDMGQSFYEAQEKYVGQRISIERIDTNGHYAKENCTWILLKDQPKNMTTNRYLTCYGERKIVSEWASDPRVRQLGLRTKALRDRMRLGWSDEQTVTTPVRSIKTGKNKNIN